MKRLSPSVVPTSVALGLASALLLAGCASPAETPSSAPASQAASSAPAAPATDAPMASPSADAMEAITVPDQLMFTATDVATGEAVDGSTLAGKDVILWFWAPWCPNCQAEAPDLVAAAAALPEGVTIVGIPGRADVASSQGFLSDYGVGGFTHLYDEDGSIWQAFDVAYQPAFAFINDDGSVETVPGSLGEDEILAAAADLASR